MSKSYLESMLSEQEKILYTTRQHWFILASHIILEIVLILIILAATVTAAVLITLPIDILIILIGFILLLIPVATMTRDILIWTNHQYIVTNRRVVQISGIINKNVTDSSLEKVNDIKMTQTVFGRLFNYGDIEILTASEGGIDIFKHISDPVHFKTSLLNAKEHLERGDWAPSMPSQDIPGLIAKLDQLRQQGVLSEEEFQSKKAELLAKL